MLGVSTRLRYRCTQVHMHICTGITTQPAAHVTYLCIKWSRASSGVITPLKKKFFFLFFSGCLRLSRVKLVKLEFQLTTLVRVFFIRFPCLQMLQGATPHSSSLMLWCSTCVCIAGQVPIAAGQESR